MAVTQFPDWQFPDPRTAFISPEGIIALGGDLRPEKVLEAYRLGIFPWPIEGMPLTWFCPPERAILEFSELHLPRSLARAIRKHPYRLTIDQAFSDVIEACAQSPRPGQNGTWITPAMKKCYLALHAQGVAHSAEVWEGTELVGGIYGVDAGGAFAGESMFHRRSNTSKIALLHLIHHLQSRGLDWMDVQVMTPHLEALGAKPIPRDRFLRKLEQTLCRDPRPPLF